MARLSSKTGRSKRKKGSANDPIDIDAVYPSPKKTKTNDTSSSTSCNDSDSEIELVPDKPRLNHLMSSLDDMCRNRHMHTLTTSIEFTRHQLDAFVPALKSYVNKYNARVHGYHQKRRKFEAVKTQGPSHADYIHLGEMRSVVLFFREALKEDSAELEHVQETHRQYGNWVDALGDLRELWTQIWDVYDRMNEPGPSSESAKVNRMWNRGYSSELWDALKEIEGRVQKAHMSVVEHLAHVKVNSAGEV